jgi:hypothetical protein
MQAAVSQLPVIGFVALIQTWVDNFPQPPLSGHETRSLGRFNTNSKIICEGDSVNAPFLPHCCMDRRHIHVSNVDIMFQLRKECDIVQNN